MHSNIHSCSQTHIFRKKRRAQEELFHIKVRLKPNLWEVSSSMKSVEVSVLLSSRAAKASVKCGRILFHSSSSSSDDLSAHRPFGFYDNHAYGLSASTLIQSSSRGYIMCCYTVTSTWGWGVGGGGGTTDIEIQSWWRSVIEKKRSQNIALHALPTARNPAYNFSLSSFFAITFLLLLLLLHFFSLQHDTCQSWTVNYTFTNICQPHGHLRIRRWKKKKGQKKEAK